MEDNGCVKPVLGLNILDDILPREQYFLNQLNFHEGFNFMMELLRMIKSHLIVE